MGRSKSASLRLKWAANIASKKDFDEKAQDYLKKNGWKIDKKSAEDFFFKQFPQYKKTHQRLSQKSLEADSSLQNAEKELDRSEEGIKKKVDLLERTSEYKQLEKEGEMNDSDLKFLEHGQHLKQISGHFSSKEALGIFSHLDGLHKEKRKLGWALEKQDKNAEIFKKGLRSFERNLKADVEEFQSVLVEAKKNMPKTKMRGGLPDEFWEQKVRNPDTGNDVMLSILDTKKPQHKKVLKNEIKKWRSQKKG